MTDLVLVLVVIAFFAVATLFILLVYFLPGGLVGLARLRPRRSGVALLDETLGPGVEPEAEARA